MKIGELLFELGFKADTMKLKDFGKAVTELNMSSIIAATGFGAVYEGAKKLVGLADDMALGINNFGLQTGQSTQEIQKWNAMADQAGVSAGTIAASIGTLQDEVFRMKFTGEGSNVWAMLGLDPTHVTDKFALLKMLHDRLHGMSVDQQRWFTEQLGMSTEMLNIWAMSNEELAKEKDNEALSAASLAEMARYHAINARLGHDLAVTWAQIGVALEPVFKGFEEIGISLDQNLLKSDLFKKELGLIAAMMDGIAHPGKLLAEDWKDLKALFSDANLPSPYLPEKSMHGQDPYFNPNSAKVHVSVKNTIQTSDPHTKVTTTKEQLDKDYNDVVNSSPIGSV